MGGRVPPTRAATGQLEEGTPIARNSIFILPIIIVTELMVMVTMIMMSVIVVLLMVKGITRTFIHGVVNYY